MSRAFFDVLLPNPVVADFRRYGPGDDAEVVVCVLGHHVIPTHVPQFVADATTQGAKLGTVACLPCAMNLASHVVGFLGHERMREARA
jgi:hypothetical protein